MVYDASAARAARREHTGEPFVFSWEGDKFELPSPREWDAATIDLMAEGKVAESFRRLLAPEQRELFFAGRPAVADIEGIMSACSRHFGIGDTAGE